MMQAAYKAIAGTEGVYLLAFLCIANTVRADISDRQVIFEQEGGIIAVEGTECRDYGGDNRGTGLFPDPIDTWFWDEGLSDEGSPAEPETPAIFNNDHVWRTPNYATRAAVYLNGFRFSYGNKDHHVQHVAAITSEQSFNNRQKQLTWKSRMELSDKGRDDEISACMYYVAVAWNHNAYDITVDDLGARIARDAKPLIRWNEPSVTDRVTFTPTAYVFSLKKRNTDQHLLQLSYGLNRPGASSFVNSTETLAAMKDNSGTTIDFLASILRIAGNSVSASVEAQDRFDFDLSDDTCGGFSIPLESCLDDGNYEDENTISRRNQDDYDLWLPVLSGFHLKFYHNDQHVKHIGAWIRNVGFNGSTLQYDLGTILTDKGEAGSKRITKVTFLGFKKTATPFAGDHVIRPSDLGGAGKAEKTQSDIQN